MIFHDFFQKKLKFFGLGPPEWKFAHYPILFLHLAEIILARVGRTWVALCVGHFLGLHQDCVLETLAGPCQPALFGHVGVGQVDVLEAWDKQLVVYLDDEVLCSTLVLARHGVAVGKNL